MEILLPPKVRATIYILVVLGGATLVPLNAAGIVSDVVLTVFTSVSTAASALAAFNVNFKGTK